MEQPFNKLTPRQAERLAVLCEELGEAQQAVGKILRHGYNSYDPTVINPLINKYALENEIAHVMVAADMLCLDGDLSRSAIIKVADAKVLSVKQWLHY